MIYRDPSVGLYMMVLTSATIFLMLSVPVAARWPKGTDGYWPKDIKRTVVDFTNEDSTWWPPAVHDMRATGRVSVVKADWEIPKQNAGYQGKTMSPVSGLVDYWNSINFTIAYGHIMNAFECIKPGSPTYDAIVPRIIELLPISALPESNPQVKLNRLPLKHTIDNGISQLEIELSSQRTRQNPHGNQVRWPVLIGMTFYAEIQMTISSETASKLFRNADSSVQVHTEAIDVKVWASATYNQDKSLSLFEYRVNKVDEGENVEAVSEDEHPGLRVMSFNVWNTNPPNWLQHGEQRFERYSKRMDLLCEVALAESPAIIAFQEVRYDSTLGGANQHCQMCHLADRLPNYYYSFTPAMSYYKANEMRRVEEGPAIASIYPIIRSDYVLLSRDVNDNRDEHQRLCLHNVIDVPKWGHVDVFSVHLSLLEEARDNSVMELWNIISDPSMSTGVTQILMGDMNAEPQEPAMQFLLGNSTRDGKKTDFVDAWLAVHDEPTPRSNDTKEKDEMLTFPSDAPTKRIDFILVRGKGATSVRNTWLVGQDPMKGIGRDPQVQEDGEMEGHLGMVHKDSKLWASDHRGIVSQLGGKINE